MPPSAAFLGIARVIAESLPEDAVVVGIEAAGAESVVTLWTTTPGLCIGRRGETAQATRLAIEAFVNHRVEFRVEEAETEEPPDSGREVVVWSKFLPPTPRITRWRPSGWRVQGKARA